MAQGLTPPMRRKGLQMVFADALDNPELGTLLRPNVPAVSLTVKWSPFEPRCTPSQDSKPPNYAVVPRDDHHI